MRRSQRAAVALAVLLAVAVPPAASASARPSGAAEPSPLLRQHFLGDTARVQAAARKPVPATAADAKLEPCEEAAPDGLCGTVVVPLDRGRPARGSVPIHFQYYRHRNPGPTSEAILATEGGPGFSVTQDEFIGPFYRDLFAPLLDTRDLILLDQRGVGGSDAIACEQVQHGSDQIYRDVRACGEQLGFASSLYSTGDVALDIEAVRSALGVDKLDFYGGSYASQDIQSYAVRFPEHLRSAVLDSPFTLVGWDPFFHTGVGAINRSIQLICDRSQSCAAEHRDALRSVAWLARRLRRDPLEGTGRDAAGQPHDVRVTEGFLLWRLLLSENGGYVALSEIAAAAEALRAGDSVPLLRLAAEHDEPLFGDEGNPTVFSAGHNFARFCTDAPQPWNKNAPIPKRLRQFLAARAAVPSDAYAPFSVDGWLAPFPTGVIGPDPCIVWPAPERKPTPAIPRGAKFPGDVPALVLSGDLDLNTPTADSIGLARAWPGSRFVEIANSGHHTATHARSDCADPMIVTFIAELEPGDTSCASDTQPWFPAVGRFPLIAADARQAEGAGGDHSTRLDRKVATVAAAAVTDSFRRTFLLFPPTPGVGLRGGAFGYVEDPGLPGLVGTLTDARFAGDVAVSGDARYLFNTQSIDATITVDGPGGEDGTLHVSGVWFPTPGDATVLEVTGTLAGRSIAVRVPAT
jgi:pimeloyl-ACP methyl ester carboxylesterase